ncbi:alpha/beta hydrolase [Roseomonas sp. NAR14]|uniref:Alpha/beta hydrolase n=1 Tax=Roseomonas acroporae TaxID=2937791 RepID=A0A9X2BV39_9PROT|nr:alpha/beta hydrolase [Roseomonas acroporae]MCK8784676.1 alpha/beta hydrolase [Roseomonas acroporae]
MDGTESWRGMDHARLEREYDARGTVADIMPILAEYRRRTDAAKAALPHHAGLRYGPTEAERLDVYPARGAGPAAAAPVFLFIHGGYWRLLDAADSGSMATGLVAAGACVVVVNYALAPSVTLEEIVRQCRAALAWVHREIHRYGGDPGAIHVSGSSAGAHLAAMLAAGGGWQAEFGLPERAVAGATLLSGLYELEPLLRCLPNDWLRLDAARARALSPALLPPPPPGLPILCSVAPGETGEFRRQTADYRARAAGAGCAAELVPAPGASNHFDIVFALDDPATAIGAALLRAMRLPVPGPLPA